MKLRPIILSGLLLIGLAAPGRAQATEDRLPRFQLEVFGYGGTLRETSWNSAVEYQSLRQELFYSNYLTYLYQSAVLSSWKESVDGAWTGFEHFYPFGARMKYNLSEHIMISLGAERLGAKATTNLSGIYTRTYADSSTDALSFEFKPYELSVKAWSPTIGIHIYQPAKDGWSAEGGLMIGPMFANILAASTWIERGIATTFDETNPRLDPALTSQGSSRMEGSGVGFCVELEGHLTFFLTEGIGLFAGVNIGLREIPKLSGAGSEVRDGVTTSWNSEWGMKTVNIARTWSSVNSEFPSNDWTTDPAAVRSGDFHLDLSGIWLGGGLIFRF
jgi:hypothetical protein